MKLSIIFKKIRHWFFLVLICSFIPYAIWGWKNKTMFQDNSDFIKNSYPAFRPAFFDVNRDNQFYQKNELNAFLTQALDYFNNKDSEDKNANQNWPQYQALLNLLPRIWTNISRKLDLPIWKQEVMKSLNAKLESISGLSVTEKKTTLQMLSSWIDTVADLPSKTSETITGHLDNWREHMIYIASKNQQARVDQFGNKLTAERVSDADKKKATDALNNWIGKNIDFFPLDKTKVKTDLTNLFSTVSTFSSTDEQNNKIIEIAKNWIDTDDELYLLKNQTNAITSLKDWINSKLDLLSQDQKTQVTSLLFNVLFQTDSGYTLQKSLPTILKLLHDFRQKTQISKDNSQSLFDRQLLSITDAEYETFDKIRNASDSDRSQKIIDYLKEIFQESGLISQSENKLKLKLEISASPSSEYSLPLRIQNFVKERTIEPPLSGVTVKLKINALEVDFNFQMVPIKLKIIFDDGLRLNYYSLLSALMKLVKLVYQTMLNDFLESGEWTKKKVQQSFTKWLSLESNSNNYLGTDLDRSKPERNSETTSLQKAFALFLFNEMTFTSRIYDFEGVSANPYQESQNFFELFEKLTTVKFSSKGTYVKLETSSCNTINDSLLKLEISTTGISVDEDFYNSGRSGSKNYGGVCPDISDKNLDNFKEDLKTFNIFEFYRAFLDFVPNAIETDNPWMTLLGELIGEYSSDDIKLQIDTSVKKQIAQSLGSFFQLDEFIEKIPSAQKKVKQYLNNISNFDSENVDPNIPIATWINFAYRLFKQNSPFINQNLLAKFDFFYENNREEMSTILNSNSAKTKISDLNWKNLNFEIEDVFVKTKSNKKYLVLAIHDPDFAIKKHLFVLTIDADTPKVVYYATNHYEYLVDQFLDNLARLSTLWTKLQEDKHLGSYNGSIPSQAIIVGSYSYLLNHLLREKNKNFTDLSSATISQLQKLLNDNVDASILRAALDQFNTDNTRKMDDLWTKLKPILQSYSDSSVVQVKIGEKDYNINQLLQEKDKNLSDSTFSSDAKVQLQVLVDDQITAHAVETALPSNPSP